MKNSYNIRILWLVICALAFAEVASAVAPKGKIDANACTRLRCNGKILTDQAGRERFFPVYMRVVTKADKAPFFFISHDDYLKYTQVNCGLTSLEAVDKSQKEGVFHYETDVKVSKSMGDECEGLTARRASPPPVVKKPSVESPKTVESPKKPVEKTFLTVANCVRLYCEWNVSEKVTDRYTGHGRFFPAFYTGSKNEYRIDRNTYYDVLKDCGDRLRDLDTGMIVHGVLPGTLVSKIVPESMASWVKVFPGDPNVIYENDECKKMEKK